MTRRRIQRLATRLIWGHNWPAEWGAHLECALAPFDPIARASATSSGRGWRLQLVAQLAWSLNLSSQLPAENHSSARKLGASALRHVRASFECARASASEHHLSQQTCRLVQLRLLVFLVILACACACVCTEQHAKDNGRREWHHGPGKSERDERMETFCPSCLRRRVRSCIHAFH